MTRLLLRGLAARKLRTALTALAVLLGVAMIAGTYVLTGGITSTFSRSIEDSSRGVDVALTPSLAFESQTGTINSTMPISLLDSIRSVPGVALAVPYLETAGSPVVGGTVVAPAGGAPAIVISTRQAGLGLQRIGSGRLPTAAGEVALDQKVVDDQHLRLGDRLGITTAAGVVPVRLVGVYRPGGASSIAGATIVLARYADVARWYHLQGRATQIDVRAGAGISASELAQRLRAALPKTVRVRTGSELAHDQLADMHKAVDTYLTPILVGFGGAAVLVAAFIIFNTFSVTVAQRVRELGLLRTLGATRRQLLAEMVGEAALIGAVASLAGLAAGLGIARLLVQALAKAGFDARSSALDLTPRTAILALVVGVGVTVLAATIPALRATRVPPVAALRRGVPCAARGSDATRPQSRC